MLLKIGDNKGPKVEILHNKFLSTIPNNQFEYSTPLRQKTNLSSFSHDDKTFTTNILGSADNSSQSSLMSSINHHDQKLLTHLERPLNNNHSYGIPLVSYRHYQQMKSSLLTEDNKHIPPNTVSTITSPNCTNINLPPITKVNHLTDSFNNLTSNISPNSFSILSSNEVQKLSDTSSNIHVPDNPFKGNNSRNSVLASNANFNSLKNSLPSVPPLPQPPNRSPAQICIANTDHLTPSRRMIDVMEERVLIPPSGIANPVPNIMHITKKPNCDPNVMRSTLNAVPYSEDILSQSRLPFAIILHPFRDLQSLQVIRSKKIVRCRTTACRAYLNPFVSFSDHRRWKCNMCHRMNELSDDVLYNRTSGDFVDSSKRLELRLSTVEYIAPKEYSLKSAQKQHLILYVFLIDLSCCGVRGSVQRVLTTIAELLERMPGFHNCRVAVIGYDSMLHFYEVCCNGCAREIVVADFEEPLDLPVLASRLFWDPLEQGNGLRAMLESLLDNGDDEVSMEGQNCLGRALLAARRLLGPAGGGRVTVVNGSCPSIGEGALRPREVPDRGGVLPMAPCIDFYKSLSVDFAQEQISVDMFQLGSTPCDLASLSPIVRYSSGTLFHYPLLSCPSSSPVETARLLADLHRYLTRKLGLDGLLRLRVSSPLCVLSSHGNFFARSPDLFSLATVSPDSGLAVRLSIDPSSSADDTPLVFVQASLLYTSSVGDRRIRVHTLALPLVESLSDTFRHADQQAIAAFLAKSLSDRLQSTGAVADAREAILNAIIDPAVSFAASCVPRAPPTTLPLPFHLRLLPLHAWGLLRSPALRLPGNNVDEAVGLLACWRGLPLAGLLADVCPALYGLRSVLEDGPRSDWSAGVRSDSCASDSDRSEEEKPESDDDDDDDEEEDLWCPQQLHLSTESIRSGGGVFLLDCSFGILLLLTAATPPAFLKLVFNLDSLHDLPDDGLIDLPEVDNLPSARLRSFVRQLQIDRPIGSNLFVIVGGRSILLSNEFAWRMSEDDRGDASYHRFLQAVHRRVCAR